MTHREEMAEIHGDEFADNFDEEFEIQRRPSVREIVLNFILSNRVAVFYTVGFIDGLVIVGLIALFVKTFL